ncbi:MAG TPA: NADH-quinone oxidoreductase subunit F, partial [Anaerolineae bacterium]|nr:NADH-quinone oxidoreductase subunit F [Anaerolineae bacterium]
MKEHILLRHKDIPNIGDIDVYLSDGGYEGLKKALETMQPAEVIEAVKASGLRGRGGAGFPTGVKWSFIPKGAKDVYIVVNADESEPGTFKDRELMEYNPHRVIEGAAIAAYAVGAHTIYIYGRGEFKGPFVTLQKAVNQAYEKGILGKNAMGTDYALDLHLHLGAGAYICGEETALLNSLEGYRG